MNDALPGLVRARMTAATEVTAARALPGSPDGPMLACEHLTGDNVKMLLCGQHPVGFACPDCHARHRELVHPSPRCECCEIRRATDHPAFLQWLLEDYPVRTLTGDGYDGWRIVRRPLLVQDVAEWCDEAGCAMDVVAAVHAVTGPPDRD